MQYTNYLQGNEWIAIVFLTFTRNDILKVYDNLRMQILDDRSDAH